MVKRVKGDFNAKSHASKLFITLDPPPPTHIHTPKKKTFLKKNYFSTYNIPTHLISNIYFTICIYTCVCVHIFIYIYICMHVRTAEKYTTAQLLKRYYAQQR